MVAIYTFCTVLFSFLYYVSCHCDLQMLDQHNGLNLWNCASDGNINFLHYPCYWYVLRISAAEPMFILQLTNREDGDVHMCWAKHYVKYEENKNILLWTFQYGSIPTPVVIDVSKVLQRSRINVIMSFVVYEDEPGAEDDKNEILLFYREGDILNNTVAQFIGQHVPLGSEFEDRYGIM